MSLKCIRSAWISAFMSFAVALLPCCLPVSAAAQTAAVIAPTSRLTQPIDEGQLVTLKGTVHRLATAANDRGAVDDGMPLDRIQVMLKRSPAQETALRGLIQQMHTPGSASYHKWLTPTQFGEQFGPSDADIATLSSWLSSHGFTVTKVNPGKQTLEIAGNAGQFNKTFHAQIHTYKVNGQMHTANAGDPSIPAALAPVFGGFASLNNFPLKSYEKVLGRAKYDPATHKSTPEWTVGDPTDGYSLLLAPGDFAVQYDLNPLYTAGTKGAGATIGIINEANISVPLVNQYRTLFDLPSNPPNVVIDGNDPGIDGVNNPDGPNNASGEAYLDVELAGAVAPSATVDLIIAGDTALSNGLGLAAEHAVYGDTAPVLSISFGSCEAGGGSGFWDYLWEQAAAQGQTVMVSAGDAGSAGCDNDDVQEFAVYGQEVNGIASTPWNVAVGGTDFYYSSYNSGNNTTIGNQLEQYWGNFSTSASNTTYKESLLSKVPEQPWNDSQFGLNLSNQYADGYGSTIAAGGGGASNCATGSYGSAADPCAGYPKPSWQTGTGVPADGVRDLPDVSLFAANGANATYYPICAADGDCQPVTSGEVQITGVGGTSASSPAFAGMMALVYEKYGAQGQANFVLYPLAKQFPTSFNDVTVGTNSVPCNLQTVSSGGYAYPPDDCLATSTSYSATDPIYGTSTEGEIGNTTTKAVEYNAGTGYDLASGLGTIDANNLVTNWGNVKFTSSSVTLMPSQTTFAHGTTVTISGAVTPTAATGLVGLETTSTEPLQTVETTFTLANGAYSGTVSYLPGGTYQIYGAYSGDGTYAPSDSSKTSITVTPEASATALQVLNTAGSQLSTGATVPYGTQLLLEAEPGSVVAANTTSTPTGTVTYLNGTASVGTAPVNAEGTAELNYAPVPSATPYAIAAKYSGDASYNTSTSAATTFTVTKDTPNLSLTSGTQSQTSITAVSGVTALTVGVENYANANSEQSSGTALVTSAVAPTGMVTLSGLPGGTLTFPVLASVVDPNTLFPEGVATMSLPAETAGTYNVTINYAGDANYAATSTTATVVVSAPTGIPTTTTATATAATSYATAASVTFTVTGTSAGGPPTGTVTFYTSGSEIGYLNIPSGGTSDVVTETISLNGYLATGTNQLIVQYSGSSVYQPSSAIATTQNGTTPATPGFTVALSNSAGITIGTPGGSGMSTVTVTPGGGFTGAVALACAVTATSSDTPTCSVTSPVTISGATAGTATLTVNTTAASAALELPRLRMLPTAGGIAAAALLFFLVPVKRRRLSTLLGALVLMAVVGLASGCGSGGSSTPGNAGTPAGTYTVTVTGTATGVTIAPLTVSVTVQ